MEDGIIILLFVFLSVGIVHFFSLKMLNVSVEKKNKIRRVFYYFYGLVYSIASVLQLYSSSFLELIYLFQTTLGIVFIVLNFLGKLDPKV